MESGIGVVTPETLLARSGTYTGRPDFCGSTACESRLPACLTHEELTSATDVNETPSVDGAGGPGRAWARPVARFLPLAVLASMMVFHGWQIVVEHDDPQRSGAFAMFATPDIGATRRVVATSPDDRLSLEIPDSLQNLREQVADRPSREAVEELARRLAALQWDESGAVDTDGGGSTLTVQVQVMGLRVNDRTVVRRVLADATVEPER